MPPNKAVYLTGAKVYPFEVKSAPYTSPRDNEIVIKNGAVAINPLDWIKQDKGNLLFAWIKYPFVLGSDVAGEVVEVGRSVTRFRTGDRVVGHAVGMDEKRNRSAEGGFQTYTVLLAHMASLIPDSLSYESAAVIPLGLSTAACGFFEKDQLALPYPTLPPTPRGKALLVWGGSTSVGCNAIQLGVAAGYEVFTTASPKNFEYVKKLGASQAFDYNSKTVVTDLIHALHDKTTCGAISIGHGSADACLEVLDKCNGDKFITMATYPMPRTPPKRFVALTTAYVYVSGIISFWIRARLKGISSNFIFGSSLIHNGVGKAIYEDFLPRALAEGTFVAAPEPHVVGKGLEYVQAACDFQKKGVSATKVVVSL